MTAHNLYGPDRPDPQQMGQVRVDPHNLCDLAWPHTIAM